jgi:hypothetical protein
MVFNAKLNFYQPLKYIGVPKGIRTPVADVKGRCPWPTRRWGPPFILWNAE